MFVQALLPQAVGYFAVVGLVFLLFTRLWDRAFKTELPDDEQVFRGRSARRADTR